ncbi:GntR family transcriptional regulator [Halovulum dunhuangense]|uniref:GntR family transcriptional regulator n=1 Tax=Halovulum dunhuangense TaxID=1505036 RepID=A0A849L6G8_9RHOB|nr:GntR family transcriptional regulator [Halovulum dunhuangense]NNU81734.1 GntR family transcriptional regulator [Halovulum dunhuangense]
MTQLPETVIVDSILDAIADQRLKAGTKLGEQALSDLFSCNRAQVRRALATLTAHHVVDHQPNRGAFVATPTAKEARDVFQARRTVEATIARNAVLNATEDDIAALRAHVAAERALPGGDSRPEAIRASRAFHLMLARLGGNSVLEQYLSDLTLRSSLILGLYARAKASLCADDEHARIVDAIAARDAKTAAHLVEEHLRHIEQGIEFTDTPPQTGLLSGILRPGA